VEYSAVGKGGGVVHDAAPGCSSTRRDFATRIPAPPRRQSCTAHDMQQLQQPAGRWNREGGVLTACDTSVCAGKERGLRLEV
jgi:hypothetical protein